MKRLFFSGVLVLSSIALFAQKATISGSVVDQSTGEPLIGVVVKHVTSGAEVMTDFDGNFTISSAKAGINELSISYVSYKETKLNRVIVKEGEAKNLNIKLTKVNTSNSEHNFLALDPKSNPES